MVLWTARLWNLLVAATLHEANNRSLKLRLGSGAQGFCGGRNFPGSLPLLEVYNFDYCSIMMRAEVSVQKRSVLAFNL